LPTKGAHFTGTNTKVNRQRKGLSCALPGLSPIVAQLARGQIIVALVQDAAYIFGTGRLNRFQLDRAKLRHVPQSRLVKPSKLHAMPEHGTEHYKMIALVRMPHIETRGPFDDIGRV
jgi:hypothetical protein